MNEAFGSPGMAATWTSSQKDIVTTALDGASQIWLTIGHGIGNEVYWPSTGQPQVRDIGFIVAHGDMWTEVKRRPGYELVTESPAVLAPTTIHHGDGWTLSLTWSIDPDRDVVLVSYVLEGEADAVYVLVAPHLGAGSYTNTAWVSQNQLFASADGADVALCLVSSTGFAMASAGYVGSSDGWQDINEHGAMTWEFDHAGAGNVALTGKLLAATGTLALGLATTRQGASILARSSLADGPDAVHGRFLAGWRRFASRCSEGADIDARWRDLAQHSAAVLACHEDRTYPGAGVASLSIPWGNGRSDLGGYHLVWARDCVEVAFARLAMGDSSSARRTLSWLVAAQQPDGHWTQNAYPDGRPFWSGVQLDEVALPILLAAALDDGEPNPAVTAMVRSAVSFLVDHGPSSPQDRWEENAGTNPFTLATIVAALIAARPWLDKADADYVLLVARYWNDRIEDWLYSVDGPLCEDREIDGYFVRLGCIDTLDARGRVDVRNRADGAIELESLISCDFLALVRFGLRDPHDPRIINTVKLIDELLAVQLPTGVAYRRYNGDGYGEHDDGQPFDGTGVGRPWPLLAGERGHYAAQAGEPYERYLDSMMAMTGAGNLLPEQVWDAAAIDERFLTPGHPTGSAMPLAWAHAEFIKLATYEARSRPIEQLEIVVATLAAATTPPAWVWRVDLSFDSMPAGRDLIVDYSAPFVLTAGSHTFMSTPTGLHRYMVRVTNPDDMAEFDLADKDGHTVATGAVHLRTTQA